jgi:PPOX class probable F420-dependent enzyme
MIDEGVRKLANAANFGTITTLMSDGSPSTHVMWVDADDEHVLINTEVGRMKYRNVKRDPRVVVTVWDSANPYSYAEVRGEVVDEVRGPAARAHIDALSQKYNGTDYSEDAIQTERVILKIRPLRQRSY